MTSRTAISSKHSIIQAALKALGSEKSCQGKYLSSRTNVAMQSWAKKKRSCMQFEHLKKTRALADLAHDVCTLEERKKEEKSAVTARVLNR